MRIAIIRLELSSEGQIIFNIRDGDRLERIPAAPLQAVEQLAAELAKHNLWDAGERVHILRRYNDRLQPAPVTTWLAQWTKDPTADAVICVHAPDERVSNLPWGDLLNPTCTAVGQGWIARVCELASPPVPTPSGRVDMLLAAWARLTTSLMPGILREINDFPLKIDRKRIDVSVLADSTRQQLIEACCVPRAILHLSPPSLVYEAAGNLAIPVQPRAGEAGSIDYLSIADMCHAARLNRALRLVVMNTCNAGLSGCRQIAESLNAVSIGWPTLVSDEVSADFTFYFYQRLLEGRTPVMALRLFARAMGMSRMPYELPVVWLPSPRWAEWTPLTPPLPAIEEAPLVPIIPSKPEEGAEAVGIKQAASTKDKKPKKPKVTKLAPLITVPGRIVAHGDVVISTTSTPHAADYVLSFRVRESVNPALLVNGLTPIEYIGVDSKSTDRDIHLTIVCDTGAAQSSYRQTIRPGDPVEWRDIHFPALSELVERQTRRREIAFTATISDVDGHQIVSKTAHSTWMGAGEWLDREDTWAFIPAFVNPHDAGVLKVFESANKVLRTLGGPLDAFKGYLNRASPRDVRTQMQAIYQTLRDEPIALRYIAPPGSPVFDRTSRRRVGQVVRTHAEVIERRYGTCHDLALLLAACAEYIGIRPLIVLVSGHTFVGYWTSSTAHDTYWTEAGKKILDQTAFGPKWTFTDGQALMNLVDKQDVVLVEATYVCQPVKTFAQACKYRVAEFKENMKEDLFDVAIDVYAARQAVQPL